MMDAKWALTAPFIPPAKTGGRHRTPDMREVLKGLLYLAFAGYAWRLLPKCFPLVSTMRRYFYVWRNAGLFDAIKAQDRTPLEIFKERFAFGEIDKEEFEDLRPLLSE